MTWPLADTMVITISDAIFHKSIWLSMKLLLYLQIYCWPDDVIQNGQIAKSHGICYHLIYVGSIYMYVLQS